MDIKKFHDLEIAALEEKLDDLVPACWPNRPGDARPIQIFQNVGHALTRWERVEVSLLEVLSSMQAQLADCNKIKRNYSKCLQTRQRIELIVKQYNKHALQQIHFSAFEERLETALENYLIWKTARNRLAHGVVIAAGPMMMDDIKNGNIQTYQLHPSESDQRNWMIPWKFVSTPNGEIVIDGDKDDNYISDGPTYNYIAKDIKKISIEFAKLDREFRELTKSFIGDKDGFEELIFEDEDLDLSA